MTSRLRVPKGLRSLGPNLLRFAVLLALVLDALPAPVPAEAATVTPTSSPTGVPNSPTVPILVKFKAGADADAAVRSLGGESARNLAQTRTRVINVPARRKTPSWPPTPGTRQ